MSLTNNKATIKISSKRIKFNNTPINLFLPQKYYLKRKTPIPFPTTKKLIPFWERHNIYLIPSLKILFKSISKHSPQSSTKNTQAHTNSTGYSRELIPLTPTLLIFTRWAISFLSFSDHNKITSKTFMTWLTWNRKVIFQNRISWALFIK